MLQIRQYSSRASVALALGLMALWAPNGWAKAATTDARPWDGCSVGLGGGYTFADHNIKDTFSDSLGSSVLSLKFDGIGLKTAMAEIQVGCDKQFSEHYLAGVEADYVGAGFSVLARAGRIVDDATLLYVIGGWTRTDFSGSLGFAGLGASVNVAADGLSFGGGAETALAEHVTAKLEYRTTNYGVTTLFNNPGETMTGESVAHSIRAIISYRFGDVKPYAGSFDGVNWTDFHVGVGVGAGIANYTGATADIGLSGDASSVGGKGFLGTVEGGYDVQIGPRFIVGAIGDYTKSDIASSLSLDITNFMGFSGKIEDKTAMTESFSILGRAGVLSSPNVLWYGLGGWTRSTFASALTLSGDLAGLLPDQSSSQTVDGLTLGLGVETMLSQNISWKTEYRYTRYNQQDVFSGLFAANADVMTARSVLSYRF
ncbi:MAG: porin family protein [Alphaproteobacteria bacterium]|nr:porin family protein [Alphaproteobacteria bacterium]